jgi:hypothetical protein
MTRWGAAGAEEGRERGEAKRKAARLLLTRHGREQPAAAMGAVPYFGQILRKKSLDTRG